jgi:tRNA pseudouridine13 synthase
MPFWDAPPRSCLDLAGTGGAYKLTPEDFEVEELPAYLPSGSGDHTFLWIEKRGLTTPEAVQRLAAALGIPAAEAGTAGLKDKQALSRQWVSLPRVPPERALGLELPGVRVLDARRHPHKLRTGHLHGNRFAIVLRGCGPGALARARAVLDRLAGRGLPNYYGEQRFGRDGGNIERARALLAGRLTVRDRRERRLLVSALQSALFNALLRERVAAKTERQALPGDVLAKQPGGGLFVCSDPAVDQPRVDRWEVTPTGPMFGAKMMAPPAGSDPAALEAAVLAESGLTLADFARAGKLAEGTRRVLVIRPDDVTAAAGADPDALRLTFALPAGSYATVLLAEVLG